MSDVIYEYAGFYYRIVKIGDHYHAEPLENQHPAAGKDKHCRAAVECWEEEQTSDN